MEFIDLSETARTETAGHSSKGNQLKWRRGENWYKADHMGYEGLAEVMVSVFLKKSSIENFAEYCPVRIKYRDSVYSGCMSRNFLNEQEELIPVEKLFRQFTGRSLARELGKIPDVKERILYMVETINEITGLEKFGEYLTAALEIDAVFLNEDRHTNNLAEICRKRIHAKPFSRDFDEQLDEAEKLYGKQIIFRFSEREIKERLAGWEGIYDRRILERAEETLRQQIRTYGYLFL